MGYMQQERQKDNLLVPEAKAFTEELNALVKKYKVAIRIEPGLGVMCFKRAKVGIKYTPSRINISDNRIVYHLQGDFIYE
jgi:hypothetical protein